MNNNKRNPKDRKKYYDSKSKKSFKEKECRKSEGTANGDRLSSLNDVSWYNRYPELLEASARVAFPNRPGMRMPMGNVKFNVSSSGDAPVPTQYEIPGVASMKWIPSFSRSSKATDPTSIAAREIYSKVRSKFSGSLDADAPDFIMYMGALDSIFSYIGALKRIYRILDTYTPQNYVLPDGLLKSMNLSDQAINALRIDKANFNLAINQLIRMTKKFAMPAAMDLFVRHYWMNDNVYTDRADINSQFYVFNQVGFYSYASLNTPDGVAAAGLTLKVAPWGDVTEYVPAGDVTTELYKFGEDLINSLSSWDDCYTISGYLMRAYEGVSQFTVDELPLHDAFSPVFVPEVLMQIENSIGVLNFNGQTPTNVRGTDVTQDPKTNSVIYLPYVESAAIVDGNSFVDSNNWINIHENNPSSDTIVVATRLHPVLKMGTGAAYDIYAATEIPLGWNVLIAWTNSKGNEVKGMRGVPQHFAFGTLVSNETYWTTNLDRMIMLSAIFQLAAFDWHPLINIVMHYMSKTGSKYDTAYTYMNGDVSNITTVDDDTMFNIHRVCTYSELNAFTE